MMLPLRIRVSIFVIVRYLGQHGDITSKRLLEVVRTVPLSNEEIQSVINELLNRQGGDSVEWTQVLITYYH